MMSKATMILLYITLLNCKPNFVCCDISLNQEGLNKEHAYLGNVNIEFC